MKRVLKFLRTVFLAVGLMALAVWLTFVVRRAMRPKVTFSDGSVLTVVKVDYAMMHEFTRGSHTVSEGFDSMIEHIPFYYDIPDKIRDPIERIASFSSTSFGGGGDSLGVWVYHHPGSDQPLSLEGAELLDDKAGGRIDYSEFSDLDRTSDLSGHFSFSVLPRRQRSFRIRVIAGNESQILTVKNPLAAETYPIWKASPLPNTQQIGELAVSLTSWESYRDRAAGNLCFIPIVRVQVGQEWKTEWFHVDTSMEDATGNIGNRLPLSEPAWKVTATISRSARHPAVLENSISFQNLRVPPPGELYAIRLNQQMRDRGFIFVAVHGEGKFLLMDGACVAAGTMEDDLLVPAAAPQHWRILSTRGPRLLVVTAEDTPAAGRVVWELLDQDGQRIANGNPGGEQCAPGFKIWVEQFHSMEDVKNFTATIGRAGKEETVEFIVPPPTSVP